jgi:hypothetical protein
MTSVRKVTLVEQRQTLRQQLLAQRQLIATQLDSEAQSGSYPRSMTMRFLTGKSAVGGKLVKSAATLLGMSVVKSLAVSLFMPMFAKRKSR